MSSKFGGAANIVPTLTAVAIATVTTLILWRRLKQSVLGKVVVTELFIYPVKSCAETSLDVATPTARGFAGDRLAQVTDETGKYCTPREKGKEKLFHVQAEIWGNSLTLKSPHGALEPLQVDLDQVGDNKNTKPVQVEVLDEPEK